MSSWGPGYVQKKGHMILPYHHFVGFGDYAEEFFKLVRSMYYAHHSNEFLFIFDKANSISPAIGLFESTLKRNAFSRYLPYYPSQGFNLSDRRDLLEPILQRSPFPDKHSFFSLFSSVFDLQDRIKNQIMQLYNRKEISPFDGERIGVCLQGGQSEFSSLIERLGQFAKRPGDPVSLFVSCQSRDQYILFREQCPSNWIIVSMWETIPPSILTEEQRMDALYSFFGSLVALSYCSHLLGSFRNSAFTFVYCNEPRFRAHSTFIVLDGSSFSYF